MKRLLHHPFVRTHLSQGIKFCVCGGIGATIDLSSLTFFVEVLDVDPAIAFIPSAGLAVTFVFFANKYFTFNNREKKHLSQAAKFAIVYGTAITSNLAISWTLLWLGVHYFLARVVAIGIGAVWNYSMSHGFVFKKGEKIDTAVF